MDTHDSHSSFIKTPQQLVAVIVASFVVPVIGIVLLVQLVTSERGADPNALTAESVAARIHPVGRVEFGGPGGGAAGGKSGEEVVKTVCAACHQAGVAGAPKIGNKADWGPRIKEGYQQLVKDAINGIRGMPPKGGNASLSDDEVARAVAFMANQAGANFKPPAPKPGAQQPQQSGAAAAPAKPGAIDGKKVFDGTCTACHSTGVADAPKLGDKAAWGPRMQQGIDTLVQSALKGKNAMPPKGGNAALSDAEVRAAVEFMVSQAK